MKVIKIEVPEEVKNAAAICMRRTNSLKHMMEAMAEMYDDSYAQTTKVWVAVRKFADEQGITDKNLKYDHATGVFFVMEE